MTVSPKVNKTDKTRILSLSIPLIKPPQTIHFDFTKNLIHVMAICLKGCCSKLFSLMAFVCLFWIPQWEGLCLLTDSRPWFGQKTLPNYKYCSLFSGGVLLTFGLQFKREKRHVSVTVTANKINPKDTFTKNPEVIGYNWNHKSSQQKHKDFQLIVNSWPITGQRGCSSGLRDWNGGHLISLREGILHHISFKSPYLQKRLRRGGGDGRSQCVLVPIQTDKVHM